MAMRTYGSPSLDRFSQGRPDPQEAPVVAYCDVCHAELYRLDEVYKVDGGVICADLDCLVDYIGATRMTAGEAKGVAIWL
mgnify:CR=1 FL=1